MPCITSGCASHPGNQWFNRDKLKGTAEGPHPSAATHLPEAASVFDAATTLDTATDMVDPQPPLVECLVRHVLLLRECLLQIEISSIVLQGKQRPCQRLARAHKRPWPTVI